MTNRQLKLLGAAACAIVALTCLWYHQMYFEPGNKKTEWVGGLPLVSILSGLGSAGLFFSAFSFERTTTSGDWVRTTRFTCPHCGYWLDYSQMPAFRREYQCPSCDKMIIIKK